MKSFSESLHVKIRMEVFVSLPAKQIVGPPDTNFDYVIAFAFMMRDHKSAAGEL